MKRVPKAHSKLQGTGCFRDGGLGLALPSRKVSPCSMSVKSAAGRKERGLCSRKGLTTLRTPALNTEKRHRFKLQNHPNCDCREKYRGGMRFGRAAVP